MKSYQECVAEFMLAFKQPIYTSTEEAPFEVHRLRKALIEEEQKEYYTATTRADELDALCDLIYVIVGTAVTYSTPIDGRSKATLVVTGNKYPITWAQSLVNDLATLFPCPKRTRESVNKSLDEIEEIARRQGYKLYPAFRAVHDNNMDKLWTITPDDPETLYTEVLPGRYLVKRLSDGKVLKPTNHPKVDLTPFV